MNVTILAEEGSFPEITYIDGDEWIVSQTKIDGRKCLAVWQNRQIRFTFNLPDEGQAFPKINSSGWIVWRQTDNELRSVNVHNPNNINGLMTPLYGNEPLVLTEDRVFFQTPTGIYSADLNLLYTKFVQRDVKPTGLSFVTYNGSVWFVDDDRVVDGPSGKIYTRPHTSDLVWVAENHDDEGLVIWSSTAPNGKVETILYPNVKLFRPRLATTFTTVTVVAWGSKLVVIDMLLTELHTENPKDPPKENPPKMRTPGITIDSYDKKLSSQSSWKLKWHDRNNSGFSGTVEFKNGSVHIGFTNPEGSDYSGAKRLVEISDSSGEQPELPFELPPVQGPTDWRGNFLALPGFEYAFMYPAWPQAKRDQFRQTYKALGLTHLPLSPWASYRNESYDFAQDPEGFRLVLQELQNDGLVVCVMAYTDGFDTFHPKSLQATKDWATWFYAHLVDDIKLVCSGWEFNQINGSEWTGDGAKHIEWLKCLRSIFKIQPLYVHFSPERTSGWPNYPNHDGPQDEASWWKALGKTVTGMLYQRPPDEDVEELLNHTIGGNGDVGDVNRISGNYWNLQHYGFHFVMFEHSREYSRWQKIVKQVMKHPLVKGYC